METLTIITLQPLLILALVLVIIFQPEIRQRLNRLSRKRLSPINFTPSEVSLKDLAYDIEQIILAVKDLAKDKYGALIVIEPSEAEHDYLSPGTPVNGDISSNLILSIFFPKSPLHDGAIIIQQGKIRAAGVILPVTDKRPLSHVYGTRHRAALGLSEILDCLCIIVSEETGSISTAYHGSLSHFSKAEELADCLNQFCNQERKVRAPHMMPNTSLGTQHET